MLDNELRGDSVDLVSVNANFGKLPADYTGPASLGHVYRGNWATGATRFGLALPARMAGFVVEGNRRVAEVRTKDVAGSLGLLIGNTDAADQPLRPTLPADSGVVLAD